MRLYSLFQSVSFPFEFSAVVGRTINPPSEEVVRQQKPWHVIGWFDEQNNICGISRATDAFAIHRDDIETLFAVVITPAKGAGYVELKYKPKSQKTAISLLHTAYRSDAVDWLQRNAQDLSEIFGQELKVIEGGADC
jgi:hypothetical protein